MLNTIMKSDKLNKFIARSHAVHGDKYDYTNVVYVDVDTKVEIKCVQHNHTFWQSPYNHANGRLGCVHCFNALKRQNYSQSQEEFITKSVCVHGDKYDYSLVEYVNNATKVKLKCDVHGVFEISPSNHYHGKQGCSKCGRLNSARSRSTPQQVWINKASQLHKNYYDYSQVKYVNGTTKVTIICPEHGSFKSTPGDHLYSAAGCPTCNSSKGEKLVENLLISLNITYVKQYSFAKCRNKFPLKFDFWLPDYNMCIEYQGKQHYEPVQFSKGHTTYLEDFERGKINDQIKQDYCANNNITLIEVPHDQEAIYLDQIRYLLDHKSQSSDLQSIQKLVDQIA